MVTSGHTKLDKAPCLSIIIVIWILSSDVLTICQLNQFNTNSEAAMLSIHSVMVVVNILIIIFTLHTWEWGEYSAICLFK